MGDKELEKQIEKLVILYLTANDEFINLIINGMAVEYPTDSVHVQSMTSMLNRITSLSNTLKNSSKPKVESVITSAYESGYLNANSNLGGGSGVKYTDTQQATLDKLRTDTYNDMLIATQYMSESAKKFVRVKTSQVMQLQQALRQGNKSLAYSLARQLEAGKLSKDANTQAFTGIVDKAGRRWNLKTYSEMVVRTKAQQAHVYGTAQQGHELGCHLFIISSHNAIDACSKWEGKIISVGEEIDGYPVYEDIAASMECFHPNCKHHITPISEGVVSRMNSRVRSNRK